MKLVFIILNYKTYEDTIRQVNEILSDGYCDFKIIVVDNCSPNESFAKLKYEYQQTTDVEVIQTSSNGGFAKGNNEGLKYAKRYCPEYVCIINNDVHFKRNVIDSLEKDFALKDDIGAISPVQLLPTGELAISGLSLATFWKDLSFYTPFHSRKRMKYTSNTEYKNLQKVGIVPGAFIFMKYDIAHKIGFFDERTFLYAEERFLSKRLLDRGYNCYIDITLSYVHEHSKTISANTTLKQRENILLDSRLSYIKQYGRYPKIESAIIYFVGKIYIFLKFLVKR